MTWTLHDDRQCELGEGPLWHPGRGQLFWFDILGKRLMTRDGGQPREWRFGDMVSAAGWVSQDELLIASERELFLYDLAGEHSRRLALLDAEDPRTRSNDGRADPYGGFWIGTMGKAAEPGLGAIWRYYKGELRRLYAPITIPNAIAFAPDGTWATFTDTVTGQVMRTRLGRDGWPEGDPEVFLDLRGDASHPDGALFDAAGTYWLAQWGGSRVAAFGPDGAFRQAIAFPAAHTSCPAFGGEGLSTLYCTTARQHLSREALDANPHHGRTFSAPAPGPGLPEHQVTP